jgi:hypothetical protein
MGQKVEGDSEVLVIISYGKIILHECVILKRFPAAVGAVVEPQNERGKHTASLFEDIPRVGAI